MRMVVEIQLLMMAHWWVLTVEEAMVVARSKEVRDLMVKVAARAWALEVDS